MTKQKPVSPFVHVGLLIAIAIVIGVGVRLWMTTEPDAPRIVSSGTALIGGPFKLVDDTGKPITDAAFRGKLMLVYFGYTYCPDICPTELSTIADALDDLKQKAKEVAPMFITVDPARDTPAVMKAYVAHFSPDLIGLTGTPAEIAAAARAYRVYYAKIPAKDGGNDYLMDHSAFAYLMDRNGKYITHFAPGTSAKEIASTIEKYL
ncbi:MAG TPA: SCO family protein [Alphaproteobacteria bacterium]|nr:SCO family protein [Alphaproteobacteria bacterium]